MDCVSTRGGFSQAWRQKFSDGGAGASDRGGAKMTEKLCLRALFCQISSDENLIFLRQEGARCLRRGGGCSPPSPPPVPPLDFQQKSYSSFPLLSS